MSREQTTVRHTLPRHRIDLMCSLTCAACVRENAERAGYVGRHRVEMAVAS